MMGVLKSMWLIVYFIPFGMVYAQFRIVGLLNVDESKADKHQAAFYQTNAQGRGFSIDDELKKFLIRPKDIIRVHVIDELNQSDHIPQSDNILMLRRKRPIVQQTSETTETNKIFAMTKEPTKSDKLTEKQTKRPTHNQQHHNVWQPQSSKFPLHKFDNVISNLVHRSSVPLKHHKPTKRNTYKSRCRCERISNCPRMQISVTRCQPNYFLCCF